MMDERVLEKRAALVSHIHHFEWIYFVSLHAHVIQYINLFKKYFDSAFFVEISLFSTSPVLIYMSTNSSSILFVSFYLFLFFVINFLLFVSLFSIYSTNSSSMPFFNVCSSSPLGSLLNAVGQSNLWDTKKLL